jgi:TPP-dependent pyruvate/acetoin dehydrogenase alpha subunit
MDLIEGLKSEIRRLRLIQLEINRMIIAGKFRIPIHMGFGHETLAVTCVAALEPNDLIYLTHRNIHFQIALGASLQDLENEYLLRPDGLANGKLGSMNLMSPPMRNIYTSNILGNNLAVALGSGLALTLEKSGGVVWVITGDGAIEEGVFYESMLMASSLGLPIVYLVENNQWSLATKINQRRIPIDLKKLAESLSMKFTALEGNDASEYFTMFREIRNEVSLSMKPQLIEVSVESLGGFIADIGEDSERYINYHAGAVRIEHSDSGVFVADHSDPIYKISEELSEK